ncbi:MAG: hypothetical protein WAS54_09785 [Scrofimicrobium sp.]
MVSGRALVLLVIVVLLLVAMVIIVGAALMQKPTRAWRLQWQENAFDLKRAGMKTLKGEPVQPRVVSFSELMDDPYVTYFSPAPETYRLPQAQLTRPVAEAGFMPERVSVLVHDESSAVLEQSEVAWEDFDGSYNYFDNSGYQPEKPEEPQLTFDEKQELGLIGSWNPGPAEVSPVPEIEPGQFWATVAKTLVGTWATLQARYGDWNAQRSERKLAAEEAAREQAEREATESAEAEVVLDSQIFEAEPLESVSVTGPEAEIAIAAESVVEGEPEIDAAVESEPMPEPIRVAEPGIEVEPETPVGPEPKFAVEFPPPPPPPPSAAIVGTQEDLVEDESPAESLRIFDEYDEDIEPTAVPVASEPEQLGEWIGGLRYLSEPRPEGEWREYVPRIKDFRDSLPPED